MDLICSKLTAGIYTYRTWNFYSAYFLNKNITN